MVDVSLRALVQSLREATLQWKPSAHFDLAGLVRQILLIRREAQPCKERDVLEAETTLLLAHFVGVKSETAPKAALPGLLRLGRFGRALACDSIMRHGLPQEKVRAMLAQAHPACGLGLFQEFLRPPTLPEKNIQLWAENLLTHLVQTDPKEILFFLEELWQSGEKLRHPLSEELLSSSFGAWFERQLEGQSTDSQLLTLARATHCLNKPELAPLLAQALTRSLSEKDMLAPAEIYRLLSRTARPDDRISLSTLHAAARQGMKEDRIDVCLTCLAGLAALRWPGTGKEAAWFHSRSKALARSIPVLAALFPEALYRRYLKALPEAVRNRVHAETFRAACRMQPGFAQARLNAAPDLDDTARHALQAMADQERAHALHDLDLTITPPPRKGPLVRQSPKGLLRRLLPEKQPTLAEFLDRHQNPKDAVLISSHLKETALTGRAMDDLNLSGSNFTNVQAIRCTFRHINFTQVAFQGADFTGCIFQDCDFTAAQWHDTAMINCTFVHCEFPKIVMVRTTMEKNGFERCLLESYALYDCRLEHCRFQETALSLGRIQNTFLASPLFRRCALTVNHWLNVRLNGACWRDCSLREESFLDTRFTSPALPDSTVIGCRVLGTSPGTALLDRAELDRQDKVVLHLALAAATAPSRSGAIKNDEAQSFLSRSADLWIRRRALLESETCMREANERRLLWSEARMRGAAFLRIVPYLLSSSLFEQANKLKGIPPCRIAGYTPSLEILDMAEELFPGLHSAAPPGEAVVIESFSCMGSTGSVAQTNRSDADFWVCYDGATAGPEAVQALRGKLDALSKWADSQYDLEAHFFLMSLEDVWANEFGFSDKESSGSAQALMLKEEFYRTVQMLAGRIPGWWLTPPGLSEKSYNAQLRSAVADPLADQGRFMDAGNASPVPPEEFFGAALWQIAKSIDNPFKSVLKLGLLEHYAATGSKPALLCDLIKRNALLKLQHVGESDPYVLLSRTVRDHYRARNDQEAVRLLDEALALKADLGDIPLFLKRPFACEHASLMAFLGKTPESLAAGFANKSRPFARSLSLGNAVSRFMTTAYKRISTATKANKSDAAIGPEDMTKLGRRIAAMFSRKKYKVMRVPLPGLRRDGIAELRFAADKEPGKKTVWRVEGKTGLGGKAATRYSEPFLSESDPVRLMAWLTVNELYSSQTLVDGDRSIAPLSTPDIDNLLKQLNEFLKPSELSNITPHRFLRAERVTHVFLAPNLAVQPEVDRLKSMALVWRTNWGEVFCASPKPQDSMLKIPASEWLKKTLPQAMPQPPRIKAYYAKGSLCPRLKLV